MDSTSGQLAIKWTGECLLTGKPYRYITNIMLNSAEVGKSSTSLSDWGHCGARSPVGWQITVRSHIAGDAPQLNDGFPTKTSIPSVIFHI